MNPVNQQRKQLRQTLRAKRQSLSSQQQNIASQALKNKCIELATGHQNFALYLQNDGEIDPKLAIESLWELDKTVLLPVMHSFRKGYLNFQKYTASTNLPHNRYGIPEPRLSSLETVAIADIDVVFMPLVGFDVHGNRLGMGGGYYDRTFAAIDKLEKKPMLIGLAHDCQQLESIPVESWDVPLDQIITPTQKIIIKDHDNSAKTPL